MFNNATGNLGMIEVSLVARDRKGRKLHDAPREKYITNRNHVASLADFSERVVNRGVPKSKREDAEHKFFYGDLENESCLS